MKLTAILLAAGHARRFGSDKRLLPVQMQSAQDPDPLLKFTLSKYLSAFDRCVVVVRDPDPALAVLKRMPDVTIARQTDVQAGMGDNIALAMQTVEISSSDAVAIALADMPLIQTATLDRLSSLAQHEQIICPRFEDRRGHPVIFGQRYFSGLSKLAGDLGARRLLSVYASQVVDVDTDDAGVLADVDTPEDWDRIRALLDST